MSAYMEMITSKGGGESKETTGGLKQVWKKFRQEERQIKEQGGEGHQMEQEGSGQLRPLQDREGKLAILVTSTG